MTDLEVWWNMMDPAERRKVKFSARVESHSSTLWELLPDIDKIRLVQHAQGKPQSVIAYSGDLLGELTAAVQRHEARQNYC
jgi:hypothetical protein